MTRRLKDIDEQGWLKLPQQAGWQSAPRPIIENFLKSRKRES
jgi:hypothetical protein